MLMSVDGKISTGAADDLDVDKDFPQIAGVREGLHQYYEIEQTTDLWSLNSGRVQAKIGVNTKEMPNRVPVSFAIIDNRLLNENGIRYLCALSKTFVLITSNADHPAFNIEEDNFHIIYQKELSLPNALTKLKSEYGCKRITIQSGGTLNSLFLREKRFDWRQRYIYANRRQIFAFTDRTVEIRRSETAGMCGFGELIFTAAL